MDLRSIYNAYITTLNDQGYTRLSPFVHEDMIHNDSKPMSPDQYGQMIVDSIQDFPGFLFAVEMLTVEEDESSGARSGSGTGTVATRLRLSYTPGQTGSVSGARTNVDADGGESQRVTFYEHVFYRFEAGKIRRVWSLVDLPKVTS